MVIVQEPKVYPTWVEKLNLAYDILATDFIERTKKYHRALAFTSEIGNGIRFDGWPKFDDLNSNIDHFTDFVVDQFVKELKQQGISLDLNPKDLPKELTPKLKYNTDRPAFQDWEGDPLAFKPCAVYEYLSENYRGKVVTDRASEQTAKKIGDRLGLAGWTHYKEGTWTKIPEFHEDGDITKPILPVAKRWAASAKPGKDSFTFDLRCYLDALSTRGKPNFTDWSRETKADIRHFGMALLSFAALTKEDEAIPLGKMEVFINRFASNNVMSGNPEYREIFVCGQIVFTAFKLKVEVRFPPRLFNILCAFIRDHHPNCKGK